MSTLGGIIESSLCYQDNHVSPFNAHYRQTVFWLFLVIVKANFHNSSWENFVVSECLLSILFVSQQINGNNCLLLIEVFSPISAMIPQLHHVTLQSGEVV